MKLIPVILIASLLTALYYFYETDRDRAPQKVFNQLVQAFKPHAAELKQQFLQQKALKPRDLSTNRINIDGLVSLSADYKMRITPQRVVVELSSSDPRLDGQTVFFEPAIDNQRSTPLFYWRCSGGSLLMRYRSKPCRTGTGLRW